MEAIVVIIVNHSLGFSITRGKKCKLLFHNGSFRKKSIKVWYSKAQFLHSLLTV